MKPSEDLCKSENRNKSFQNVKQGQQDKLKRATCIYKMGWFTDGLQKVIPVCSSPVWRSGCAG